jgi:hypothetical protein
MGFGGGRLSCRPNCTFDVSECTGPQPVAGTYTIDGWVYQACATRLVDYSFGELELRDDGSLLVVGESTGLNCVMYGPSAKASRSVAASCYLQGSCREVYSLVGEIGPDGTFTGTFSAAFTPWLGGSCADCTDLTVPIRATRNAD